MARFSIKYLFALSALYLLSSVNANSNEDVKSAFEKFEIVPDLIPNPPKRLLKVTYENTFAVNEGNELTPKQVKDQPKVEYDADNNSFYTLVMVDHDAPSRVAPNYRSIKHWMVVNIPGNKIEEGQVIASYAGYMPGEGSGLHRYTFLLYKQPGKIAFTEAENRFQFNITAFAQEYKLGPPFAGNFFQAQYQPE